MSFLVTGSSKRRPIRRFTAKMVLSGLVTAWRLAGWPTRRSPSLAKATIDGVVRAPSAFSTTFGLPPSITATQLLVVPRSIPITLAIWILLCPNRISSPRPFQTRRADVSPEDIGVDFIATRSRPALRATHACPHCNNRRGLALPGGVRIPAVLARGHDRRGADRPARRQGPPRRGLFLCDRKRRWRADRRRHSAAAYPH